jgi:hypothetical protein
VRKPNDAIDLTVVYQDAGAGRLTASIAVVAVGPAAKE